MNSVAPLPLACWSPARTLAAGLIAGLGLGLLACAALYLSAALFLLLGNSDLRQASLTSSFDYWSLYADDPRLRSRLQVSAAVPGIVLLVLLPLGLVIAARPRRSLHGDARFATVEEITKAGLLPKAEDPDHPKGTKGPGILVGRHQGRYLALPGQLSVMLSAPTRSGKGVGVVIPNLLNWPDSVVVLDIKGENFSITAGYRAERGQAVYAFSPFDEGCRSHRWNPLTCVRTSPLHRVGDLLAIGQVFFPNDGAGTSSEAFFNDQARNLFLGLGLLLLETPGLPRSVGEMLRQSSGQGRSLKEHLGALICERHKAGAPLSDECVDALQRLLSNSENTLSSIVATFNAPLTIFADAIVDAATSADDFRLQDLRRERMSIYVRIPPNRLASARPLLNLFFSQLVNLNAVLPKEDETLKYQCLLVQDEFAAMGRVGVIANAAAFLAGYNLRLLTVVQAMSQLDAVYGDKEARTFATNHGLQILYAPREQRDADEYSAMLGHYTERVTTRGRSQSTSGQGHSSVNRNESVQRRALLLPQEFKELGSERLVVIVEDCKPILGEKIRYHREQVFTERLRPAPKVDPMDMDLHQARVQQRCRELPEELPPGQGINVKAITVDCQGLPDPKDLSAGEGADLMLDAFQDKAASAPAGEAETSAGAGTPVAPDSAGQPVEPDPAGEPSGGTVEPAADEDGVIQVATGLDVRLLETPSPSA